MKTTGLSSPRAFQAIKCFGLFLAISIVVLIGGISTSGEIIPYRLLIVDLQGKEPLHQLQEITVTAFSAGNGEGSDEKKLVIDPSTPPSPVTFRLMVPRIHIYGFVLPSSGVLKVGLESKGSYTSKTVVIDSVDKWATQHSILQNNEPVVISTP
jgi:hypothetical protein